MLILPLLDMIQDRMYIANNYKIIHMYLLKYKETPLLYSIDSKTRDVLDNTVEIKTDDIVADIEYIEQHLTNLVLAILKDVIIRVARDERSEYKHLVNTIKTDAVKYRENLKILVHQIIEDTKPKLDIFLENMENNVQCNDDERKELLVIGSIKTPEILIFGDLITTYMRYTISSRSDAEKIRWEFSLRTAKEYINKIIGS